MEIKVVKIKKYVDRKEEKGTDQFNLIIGGQATGLSKGELRALIKAAKDALK